MLDPGDRALLWDSLEPPDGYDFAEAIGTSFSLDLLGLASIPLSLTFRALADDDGGGQRRDPLAMIEALRRHAGNITVFAQAGQVKVPPHNELIYSHLEPTLVQVAVDGGVFHPKVWALRFTSDTGQDRYRLLVLSRNLTFDRSWDVALRLDGELRVRRNAMAANHPLGAFFDALPGQAVEPVSAAIVARCRRFSHDLRRVDFELPADVSEITFWPLGIDGYRRYPFEGRIDRMAIVSPFLQGSAVGRLTERDRGDIVVSRDDQLDELGSAAFEGLVIPRVLDEDADLEPTDEEDGPAPELRGLHAKIYVADAGWDASVWIGSANATRAAFERNVEFLVELTGAKGRLGIDQLFGKPEVPAGFGALLRDYPPAALPVAAPAERALERDLDEFAALLARSELELVVAEGENATYALSLRGVLTDPPPCMSVSVWPTTTRKENASRALVFDSDPMAQFHRLSLESITAFLAFDVVVERDGAQAEKQFVLKLPLVGEPAQRYEAILRSLLRNSRDVLRYLLFLLEDDVDRTQERGGWDGPQAPVDTNDDPLAALLSGQPVFEMLMLAACRSPERLDRVARFLADLEGREEDVGLVPAELASILQPILDARS